MECIPDEEVNKVCLLPTTHSPPLVACQPHGHHCWLLLEDINCAAWLLLLCCLGDCIRDQ